MTEGRQAPEKVPRFVPMRGFGAGGAGGAFRPSRGLPAAVAALALLAIGGLTTVHVVSALLGRPVRLVPYEQWARWASTTAWNDGRTLAVASALALIGLVLILIAVVPGRGRMIALRTGDPDLVVGLPRRALARALGARAGKVDGVRAAGTRMRGWHADVSVRTDLRDTKALAERVRAAVEDELARLAPAHHISLNVRVRGPS
ncbi:alkaline shock response membrane anchor protein AmaP [Microbispora hainanensis]|uniref:Alkaline shock response membrane anchor protein AmaP n=1 Tax=Microbispora hainanensis TaxID=568844 RepID=A0ABZ1SLD8_9ACTN|nr:MULTISPECIES: DUF6286 domain-containing protein [Microbispora]NJP26936.1 alkaline shock response membrane anchor protein AmaP [Microbispora sp. CL1-1]TQS11593.1 alkaline shock response membrane anchor protein AmaP [Microbispora sp. SCL1-1]